MIKTKLIIALALLFSLSSVAQEVVYNNAHPTDPTLVNQCFPIEHAFKVNTQ